MQASEIAWQPLTPHGVACFSRGRQAHLHIVQLVVAMLAAATLVWFLSTAWFPVIGSAIQRLPPGGAIQARRLMWTGEPAVVLGENHFLALAVDLQHEGKVRSPAHVQLEFGATDVRAFSLLGLLQAPYPSGWRIAFNRAEMEPWWGAWSPVLLAIAAGAMVVWLFVSWFVLATVYCPVAWLIGFFADRHLTLSGAWRLSGAALMPGAIFLIAATFLYGLGVLDVVRLLAAFVAHLVVGWIYIIASPFWCPRYPSALQLKGNPFSDSENKTPVKSSEGPATPKGPAPPAP